MADLEGKCALVTGGAGAIGSNLVHTLLENNCKVFVLDDLSSGYEDLLPSNENLQFIEGSITDDDALEKAFSEKIDIVFHLAAFFANQNSVDHPDRDLSVNGLGTLKVLQRAHSKGVERFVYASSSCVYGNKHDATEDTTGELDTPYAITKLLGEQYVHYFNRHHELPTTILRIFNSYGPGEKPGKYRNVIPNFFKLAMEGSPLPVFGTGEETRDFNWIGNLMWMFLTVATNERAIGETFNVGSGAETKIIDLANEINRITGNPGGVEHKPVRSWDSIKRRCANIQKAQQVLGYAPETGTLGERLEETYAWLKENA